MNIKIESATIYNTHIFCMLYNRRYLCQEELSFQECLQAAVLSFMSSFIAS
jgi:hypothetical protein